MQTPARAEYVALGCGFSRLRGVRPRLQGDPRRDRQRVAPDHGSPSPGDGRACRRIRPQGSSNDRV